MVKANQGSNGCYIVILWLDPTVIRTADLGVNALPTRTSMREVAQER